MRLAIFTDTFLPQVNGVSNTLKRLGIYLEENKIEYLFITPEQKSEELIPYHMESFLSAKFFLYPECRLSPEKDLDILRDAIEILHPEFGQRIRWIITGDGPMLKELKKTLGDQVIYTGYKKGRELAEIYASSDILTFPSTFETFGNVVLEAFASGIPVVGAKAGGVQHIVEHDYNGYLSRPRDTKDFAQGIREMLNHQELCKTYGENARNYALSKSWNHIFDTLMDDFERMIHQGKEEKNDIA